MGRGSKKSANRPIANAESFDDVLDFIQYDAVPFLARGMGYAPVSNNNSGAPNITITSSNALSNLQSAAAVRLVDLLKDNPELIDTNYVMLPSGKIIKRPNDSLTQEQAIQRVYDDAMKGRTPDPYEKAIATGDIVSRYTQGQAQAELRNRISNDMVQNKTYDAVPVPDQNLLRRAAGLSSGDVTSANVEIKAKIWQSRDGGGGNKGKFADNQSYKDLMRRTPDGSAKSKIANAIKDSSNVGDAKSRLQRLINDPNTTQSEKDTIRRAINDIR